MKVPKDVQDDVAAAEAKRAEEAAKAEAAAQAKAEADAAKALRGRSAAEEIADLEARITPLEEIFGHADELLESDRKLMELVTRSREKMRGYATEVDQLRERAEQNGVEVQIGVVLNDATLDPKSFQGQIVLREQLIRKLFIAPLKQDDPKAERLLAACGLSRAIHRRRQDGADFGGVSHFLGSGEKQGFYEKITTEEYNARVADPEHRDLKRRAIHYGGHVYILKGRQRGFWLLHGEMVEFRNAAREAADAERDLEATILNDPLPKDLAKLLQANTPPPAQPVKFGVVVKTVAREGKEPIMIGRLTRERTTKPSFGVLQLSVGPDDRDPTRKRFSVLAATGTVRRALPRKFRDDGSISCQIRTKPDPKNPKCQISDIPGWCRDILTYVLRLGHDGLQELRSEWVKEAAAHKRRDRERQSRRRGDLLLGESAEQSSKPKRNGKKATNGAADALPPAETPPPERDA